MAIFTGCGVAIITPFLEDGSVDFEGFRDMIEWQIAEGMDAIVVAGTSLTVNSVEDDVFTVLLIPHSFAVTTWGQRGEGDPVHVEVDLMARYAARLAEARPQG